ncbi:Holliday junction branch migration protein RuvA [Tengunoibacter tsumagoiensis]|uniref:Holliday junction branch migration complex subunit RuvA n=1 Tax=Tengunoibacter tsumagoiensis TaxID=2014871 RepID=A0A402A216_9CHLR|nr:Holliday junction branch migration protein RuvA [Tengunoibacter tsumagoiensis]GCE13193.1 Holliday junction ATP-dependent DNA helicase RuvA [Tengunoibacter tsumagoiensis]
MITNIYGTLEASLPDAAIIRVGGFGVRVFAPLSTLSRLNEPGMEVSLFTHFHMREDGIALYGFITEADRDAFEQMIGINGVGPKVALALLSNMSAIEFYQAVANDDQQRLGLARGVGKKLAAQIIVALKGKLPPATAQAASGPHGAAAGRIQAEALEALMGLGFSAAEAQAALAKLPQDQVLTLEQQVTLALRSFSR